MTRRLKLIALVIAPAILVAGLTKLAATKENNGQVQVSAGDAGQSANPDQSREADLRRLDELQKQLGVYRPWAKSGS